MLLDSGIWMISGILCVLFRKVDILKVALMF